MADLDQAYYRVLTGFEKLERDQIPMQDRRVTAVHEAGHALVTKLVSPESSVPRVSIIPSTGGMGTAPLGVLGGALAAAAALLLVRKRKQNEEE